METEIKICKILEVVESKPNYKRYRVLNVELCNEEGNLCHIITGDLSGSIVGKLDSKKEEHDGICAWTYPSSFYYDVAHTSNLEKVKDFFNELYMGREYVFEDNIMKIIEKNIVMEPDYEELLEEDEEKSSS